MSQVVEGSECSSLFYVCNLTLIDGNIPATPFPHPHPPYTYTDVHAIKIFQTEHNCNE